MADSKITALTEDTSPVGSDLLTTVDDPAGTPVNKKATIQNVVEAPTNVSAAGWVVDEDNMASDLATKVPTQQSVKAYVDTNSGASGTMARIAGSTYSTIQHMQDIFHSVGVTTGGGITDDTDGTITVAAGTGLIRATDSVVAEMMWTDWSAESGANVNLTDNDMNYVYVEYNAGSPRVIATISKRTDENTNILLGTVYRSGTTLHITTATRPLVGDHALRMINRLKETLPFVRASGGTLGASGTRNITVSAGNWWIGLTKFTTSAFDSSGADRFTYYYRDGVGGWTAVTAQSQINNTQYDDGDGTLGTLTGARYGVHWVYISNDDAVSVLYGQGNYTLAQAQEATAPASVPPHFDETHVKLIGKIIIQSGASSFTAVISAFDTVLSGSAAADHGDLSGLSDDDHTQYSLITSQAGAPSSTPSRVGEINIDTTNDLVYISTDTASSADWDLMVDSDATQTLTNKTIDANNNTISNIALGAEATGALTDLSDVDTDKSKTPADGDVLTFDGTDWNAETPSAGGSGQTLYDVVLDASGGGDYTDFSTALAALTTGQTLFIRSGTYTETGAVAFATADVTIIGENKETSVIQLNSTSNHAWSADGLKLRNLTLENTNSGRIQLTGADQSIENCIILLTTGAVSFALQQTTSASFSLNNCLIQDTSASDDRKISIGGIDAQFNNNICQISNGTNSTTIGWLDFSSNGGQCNNNMFHVASVASDGPVLSSTAGSRYTIFANNNIQTGSTTSGIGIYTVGEVVISGNSIKECSTGIVVFDQSVVTGNQIANTSATTGEGIICESSNNVITGNHLQGNSSANGIEIATTSDNNTISGNVIMGYGVGVSIPASTADNNVIIGNSFSGVTTDISDSGTGTLYQTATDSDALNTS